MEVCDNSITMLVSPTQEESTSLVLPMTHNICTVLLVILMTSSYSFVSFLSGSLCIKLKISSSNTDKNKIKKCGLSIQTAKVFIY